MEKLNQKLLEQYEGNKAKDNNNDDKHEAKNHELNLKIEKKQDQANKKIENLKDKINKEENKAKDKRIAHKLFSFRIIKFSKIQFFNINTTRV